MNLRLSRSLAVAFLIGFIFLTSAIAERYEGHVGKLKAVFKIEWGGDKSVGGTYWYPSRKGVVYTLDGEFGADGKLILREYTGGKLTAVLTLSDAGRGGKIRWSGKMKNTDGREFEVSFGD